MLKRTMLAALLVIVRLPLSVLLVLRLWMVFRPVSARSIIALATSMPPLREKVGTVALADVDAKLIVPLPAALPSAKASAPLPET